MCVSAFFTRYTQVSKLKFNKNINKTSYNTRCKPHKLAKNYNEKVNIIANHITNIFQPFPFKIPQSYEEEIEDFLDIPF